MWVLSSFAGPHPLVLGRAHPGEEPAVGGEQLLGGQVEGVARKGGHHLAGDGVPGVLRRGSASPRSAWRTTGSVMLVVGPRLGELEEHDDADAVAGGQHGPDEASRAGPGRPRGPTAPRCRPTTSSRWRSGDGTGPGSARPRTARCPEGGQPPSGEGGVERHRHLAGGLQRGDDAERAVLHDAVAEEPDPVGVVRRWPARCRGGAFGPAATAWRRGGHRGRRRHGAGHGAQQDDRRRGQDPDDGDARRADPHPAPQRAPSRPGGVDARSGRSWRRRPPSWRRAAPTSRGHPDSPVVSVVMSTIAGQCHRYRL